MKKIFQLSLAFILFVAINISLYFFILRYHSTVPFNKVNYIKNFHHYIKDPRIEGKPFQLLNALGQSDAQWYLKIAAEGYPYHPVLKNNADKNVMDGLTYAFFPLYPITIATLNVAVHDIELSAFILSNILMALNFFSLYFVVSRLTNHKTAIKTIFLLFVFPFSIFYRSYFTEGLFLLLTVWFSWYLIQKKWIYAAIALGLLNVTKSNALLLNGLLFIVLYKKYKQQKISKSIFMGAILCMTIPFVAWMIYCFFQTGNPFYFVTVRGEAWYAPTFPLFALIYNFGISLAFPLMPFHGFHFSKIDTITLYLVLFLLIKSRKTLNKKLWWISLALWLGPLLTTDSMSFTRYQIVSYPLFLYTAMQSHIYKYSFIALLSVIGLLFVSLYFVNWYWIG